MTYSEKLISELNRICDEKSVCLFDAASIYCEENNIEPEDMVESLDKGAVSQLKASAVDANYVRKSVQKKSAKLF